MVVGEREGSGLRETAATREGWIACAAVAAMWVAIGVVVAIHEGVLWLAPGLVFAASFAYSAVRVSRSGLLIGRDEVVIRAGVAKPQHFPIAQVREFTAGTLRGRRPRWTPGILLITVDGTSHPVWPLSRRAVTWKLPESVAKWRPVADDLNRRLEVARGGGRATGRAAASSGSSRAPA